MVLEKFVLKRVNEGMVTYCRKLEDKGEVRNEIEYEESNQPLLLEDFYVRNHGKVVTFHLKRNDRSFLGANIIKMMEKKDYKKLVFVPVCETCPVIDGFRISLEYDKEKNTPKKAMVWFIQGTISRTHRVSPSALFAMLVMVHSLKHSVGAVAVAFQFVVPKDVYEKFRSHESVFLTKLFEELEFDMKVVCFNMDSKVLPATPTPPSSPPTNKQKKVVIKEKKITMNKNKGKKKIVMEKNEKKKKTVIKKNKEKKKKKTKKTMG
jgi:hypothetical protein